MGGNVSLFLTWVTFKNVYLVFSSYSLKQLLSSNYELFDSFENYSWKTGDQPNLNKLTNIFLLHVQFVFYQLIFN